MPIQSLNAHHSDASSTPISRITTISPVGCNNQGREGVKVGVRSMVTAKVGETMEKIEVGKGGRMREEVTRGLH